MQYTKLNFPKDSKFLITGGAGFIGSNIVEALLKMGYFVRCLDDFSTGKMENIQEFMNNSKFELLKGDIRDFDTCLKACEGIDYVSHQAAWGSVPRSIDMPLVYEDINIGGTLNMMEASRQQGVKRFVYASSSSVYGDEPNLPKIEERIVEFKPVQQEIRIDQDNDTMYVSDNLMQKLQEQITHPEPVVEQKSMILQAE